MEEYMYVVSAVHDEDGGFGDAVETSEPVAVFTSESDAQRYLDKYSKPYIYDQPYDALWTGGYRITRVILNPDKKVEVDD